MTEIHYGDPGDETREMCAICGIFLVGDEEFVCALCQEEEARHAEEADPRENER